jgi:hypothetical protein
MIVSGVPQGSILGPMLFILYVNNLPYKLGHEDTPVMYADDKSVLLTAKNEAELKDKINPVLTSMMERFSANGLVLNIEKTNIMKFTSSNCSKQHFKLCIRINYYVKIIILNS